MRKEFTKEDLLALHQSEQFAKFIKWVFQNREICVSNLGELNNGFSESPEQIGGKAHAYQSVLMKADYLSLFDKHKIKVSNEF